MGIGILSEKATLPFLVCLPSLLGSTLKGKNRLPLEQFLSLTLLHSERPRLHTILAFLSAIGLKSRPHNELVK